MPDVVPLSQTDIMNFVREKRKHACMVCGSAEFSYFNGEQPSLAFPLQRDTLLRQGKIAFGPDVIFYIAYECSNCSHAYFIPRKAIVDWKAENG